MPIFSSVIFRTHSVMLSIYCVMGTICSVLVIIHSVIFTISSAIYELLNALSSNLDFKLGFIFQCHLSVFHFFMFDIICKYKFLSPPPSSSALGFGLKTPLVNFKPVYSTAIN